MHEAERHALRIMLEEELGRQAPPDLVARILAAAERRGPAVDAGPLPPVERPPVPNARGVRRPALWLGALLGASAAAVALLVWPAWRTAPDTGRVVLRCEVRSGAVAWRGAAGAGTWRAGESCVLLPAVGDRLRARALPAGPTILTFSKLGTLRCAPATELEVREMIWKDFSGGVAVGAVTVGVVAGAITWFGGGEAVEAGTGEQVELRGGTVPAPTETAGVDADLAQQLAGARQRIAELEIEVARRPARAPAPEAASEPALPAPLEPLLADSAYADALGRVDWDKVGRAINGYLGVHREILLMLETGEEVPMSVLGAEDRWEGELFQEAGLVIEAGLPGMTVTAQAHHPALGANLLNAALAAAGQPLDEGQRRTVEDLSRRYAAEDAARRASYGDDTPDLERFVDEAEMHGRYYGEMRGLLRAEQDAPLSFGEYGARVGVDPFGSGFQWSKWNQRVVAPSREALSEHATAGLVKQLGLDAGTAARLRPMVDRWVARLPAEWLDQRADALDMKGRYHIGRVRSAALEQVELMREMARGLGLTEEQLRKLRSSRAILVPFLSQ